MRVGETGFIEMEKIIEAGAGLWVAVPDVHPDYDDGLITIRDDSGGDVLVDKADIPKLIEALQEVLNDQK